MGRKKSKFRCNPERGKGKETAVASSSAASPPWIDLSEDCKRKKGKDKVTAVASSSAAPPWIDLPEDITANILKRLGDKELLETAQMVCTTWRKVSLNPSMWRVIYWRNLYESDRRLCFKAVDRSQGQLVDLTISTFCSDKMLFYIADRASHLRCLRLNWCIDISTRAVTQSVKKLPNLEELHLDCVPLFEVAEIESIGISCPLLKSFTLSQSYEDLFPGPLNPREDLDQLVSTCTHAFAIAKTMPNLVQLRIVGLWLKGEGLEAILNGCPRLELLDLRCCHLDDVGEELRERCLRQVKCVRQVSEEFSESEISDFDESDGCISGDDDMLPGEDYDALSCGSSVDSDDDDEVYDPENDEDYDPENDH